MNITSEESLWYFFKKGDLGAFRTLFEKYYPPLRAYGVKISHAPELTEDCLQNFFIYLFENRTNLGNVKSVKSYLFISFKRRLLKQLQIRNSQTRTQEVLKYGFPIVFSPQEIAVKQEVQFLCTKTLHSLLNDLPSREKEAIYLKYYSGMAISEISDVMGITYQSVLNILQKAMTKLRKSSENQLISDILRKN
jgi:RNA polymerase sigma factor (sigma-70 family)